MLAILQKADVNIASMNVARSLPAQSEEVPRALCFMALDNDVPAPVLASLQQLGFLQDVAKIQLQ